jgi:hypothetical protein
MSSLPPSSDLENSADLVYMRRVRYFAGSCCLPTGPLQDIAEFGRALRDGRAAMDADWRF